MTRLSPRCTLFPFLSEVPTSTQSPSWSEQSSYCVKGRLAGITTYKSAVLTTSPGVTFWSTTSTTPLPGSPPTMTLSWPGWCQELLAGMEPLSYGWVRSASLISVSCLKLETVRNSFEDYFYHFMKGLFF